MGKSWNSKSITIVPLQARFTESTKQRLVHYQYHMLSHIQNNVSRL